MISNFRQLLVLILVPCFAYSIEVNGVIKTMVNGVRDNQFRIYLEFEDTKIDSGYRWNKDTTDLQMLSDTVKWFRNAFNRERRIKLEVDENRIIKKFEIVKGVRVGVDTYPKNRKKPVKRNYWQKPDSVHKGYDLGDTVLLGPTFISLIPNNILSPREGHNYWQKINAGPYYVPFKKPTGAHNCYNIGTPVVFENMIYSSKINGNIWSPEEYPRGWELVEKYKKGRTSPYLDTLTPLPALQSAPTASPYTQPTGAHDAYKTGAVVTYNGKTYRSTVDANIWAPDVAINFWELASGEEEITNWRKPTGIVDCYHIGNKVIFNGKTWESTINSNVWSPEEFAQGWKIVE